MQVLYHATNESSAKDIIEMGYFKLVTSESSEVENELGKDNYISLARSLDNAFFRSMLGAFWVVFTLKKDRLQNNYKLRPVDYWQAKDVRRHETDETEDRVSSKKHRLQFKPDWILNLKIIVPENTTQNPKYTRFVIRWALKNKVKVEYYKTKKDLIGRINKQSLKDILPQLKITDKTNPAYTKSSKKEYMSSADYMLYLYNFKKKREYLPERVKRTLAEINSAINYMLRYGETEINHDDLIRWNEEIYRDRKRPEFEDFHVAIKKTGATLKDPLKFYQFIYDKFKTP